MIKFEATYKLGQSSDHLTTRRGLFPRMHFVSLPKPLQPLRLGYPDSFPKGRDRFR
jgi:hypothetical protein